MRLAPYQIVPLSDFRRNCARYVDWVKGEGGRVWVSRHGKCVASLVPMYQCERLEKFERRSLVEERLRIEAAYSRWKRAVATGVVDEVVPFQWKTYGTEDWEW